MGRTACTEPQCLYKGALYLLLIQINFSYEITEYIKLNFLFYPAINVTRADPSVRAV